MAQALYHQGIIHKFDYRCIAMFLRLGSCCAHHRALKNQSNVSESA